MQGMKRTKHLSSAKTNSMDLNATVPCPSWRECPTIQADTIPFSPCLSSCIWMRTHPHISGFQKHCFSKIDVKLQLRLEQGKSVIKICICNKNQLTAGFNIVWSLYATVSSVVSSSGGNAHNWRENSIFQLCALLHLGLRQANTSKQKSARTMQFPWWERQLW